MLAAQTVRPSSRLPVALLVLFALMAAAALGLTPPLPQDPAYHNFADRRTWLGVPNFADVSSNLALLLAGLWGLWSVRYARFRTAAERKLYGVFFAAITLTAVGSAYYHLDPTTPRLFWDRLPLALALSSLPALLIAERAAIHRGGGHALILWLALGPASALYWHFGEAAGRGDLRLYALIQLFAVVVPLIVLAWLRSPYTHSSGYLAAFGFYLLAKLAEHWDAALFALTGFVSGHTLKHLGMGLAAAILAYMLARRKCLARLYE